MKVIINQCFGGASLSESYADCIGADCYCFDRDNTTIIEDIEDGLNVNGSCSRLAVVDVPDNATDYIIQDYDGMESVLYVMDGKICWL